LTVGGGKKDDNQLQFTSVSFGDGAEALN
jgi:hypothetical protein